MILEPDTYYVYFVEKWLEQHCAVSQKDTFYHRFVLKSITEKFSFETKKMTVFCFFRFSMQTLLNLDDKLNGAGHGDEQCYTYISVKKSTKLK